MTLLVKWLMMNDKVICNWNFNLPNVFGISHKVKIKLNFNDYQSDYFSLFLVFFILFDCCHFTKTLYEHTNINVKIDFSNTHFRKFWNQFSVIAIIQLCSFSIYFISLVSSYFLTDHFLLVVWKDKYNQLFLSDLLTEKLFFYLCCTLWKRILIFVLFHWIYLCKKMLYHYHQINSSGKRVLRQARK